MEKTNSTIEIDDCLEIIPTPNKDSIHILFPYEDAFHFACIINELNRIYNRSMFLKIIERIDKVYIRKPKKLGIGSFNQNGILIQTQQEYNHIFDALHNRNISSKIITHDVIESNIIIPVLCDKDHTMFDLIRKK